MNAHLALKRLLEATIFAVLAGAIGYGVTAWLAPTNVSALTVAAIVWVFASLTVLVPSSLLDAFGPPKRGPWSAPDSLASDETDSPIVNPGTGLPMMGGLAGLDAGGNAYGSSEESETIDNDGFS